MKHIGVLLTITSLYLITMWFTQPWVYTYTFTPKLVEKYLCSQNITFEVPCKRLFLSDSDVHIAAGYMYVHGADPTKYHFEHGPLMKYLYGLTILITNNPFHLEILLGIGILSMTYLLSYKIFKSRLYAFVAALFLIADPLFRMLSADASFEFGQTFFLLLYVYMILFKKERYVIQGILLGLFASAKFWGAVPFFVGMVHAYLLLKKDFDIVRFLKHAVVAFLVYSATYFQAFFLNNGLFNVIFYQLKVLKFWSQHSVASTPFSSVSLFLAGSYKSWWGDHSFVRAQVWSPVWPIAYALSLWVVGGFVARKKISVDLLYALIPVLYIFYIGMQAPFSRYFILLLPFMYCVVSKILLSSLEKTLKVRLR